MTDESRVERRRRRWFRPRNIVILAMLAVVAIVLWIVLEYTAELHAEPSPDTDYAAAYAELTGVEPFSADCSWLLLEQAFSITSEICDEVAEAYPDPRDLADYPGAAMERVYMGTTLLEDLEPERRVIALMRERGVFDLVGRASEMPIAQRPPGSGMLLKQPEPLLARSRGFTQISAGAMRLTMIDADEERVVEAFDQGLAVSAHAGHQFGLISALVGFHLADLMLDELRHELMEAEFGEATSRALLASIERRPAMPSIEIVIEGDRLSGMDAVQWCYTDDGDGNGRPVMKQFLVLLDEDHRQESAAALATVRSFVKSDRAETTADLKDFYDSFLEEARRVPADWYRSPLSYQELIDQLPPGQLLLRTILPRIDFLLTRSVQYRINRTGTRVMLALEIFHARHGRYPESLDALAPSILDAVPLDPLHGGPFGYRVVDDDPYGRPYLLYSTCVDETDDGGRDSGQVDHTYAIVSAFKPPLDVPGTDYVINRPRHVPDF